MGRQPYQFTDERKQRIYENLIFIGPGPAAFYLDACRMMDCDKPLETQSHLIAHCFREIESAVRDALTPFAEPLLKSPTGTDNHKKSINAVLSGLGIGENDTVAIEWLSLADKKNCHTLHAMAHRDNLRSPRPVDKQTKEGWVRFESILDRVLQEFTAQYLRTHDFLDDLAAKAAPSNADADLFAQKCPHNEISHRYFFEKISTPNWMEPLLKAGFFSRPPGPIYHDNGYSLPHWPASKYLIRMAPLAPEQVMEVIINIPNTSNCHIHSDLMDALAKIEASIGIRALDNVCMWIVSTEHHWFPDAFSKVIVHWASNGQVEAALKAASVLLQIFPDARYSGSEDKEGVSRVFSPEPHGRYDANDYSEVLRIVKGPLANAGKLATLRLFCDLLQVAVEFTKREAKEEGQEDYYYSGPPAIEEHEQNRYHEYPKDELVYSVRDIAEIVIETEARNVFGVIEEKSNGPAGMVFRRIGLYLRKKHPDIDPEGTSKILAERELYERDEVLIHHELYHLLEVNYDRLSPEAKETYLDWVKRKPIVEAVLAEYPRLKDQEQHKKDEYRRRWEYNQLYPIHQYLSGDWKARYDELSKEFSPSEHPDFHSYVGPLEWGSDPSPKSSGELTGMSVMELAKYLSCYESPQDDWTDSSYESLAKEFEVVIATNPGRYADELTQFIECPPTFLEAIFDGYKEALKEKREFPWGPVIEFAVLVVGKPRGEFDRKKRHLNGNPGLGRCRQRIAGLLRDALNGKVENPIPIVLRTQVWKILEALMNDPDPNPEREHDSSMDAPHLAINSVRGEAMHAVFNYMQWLRELVKGKDRSFCIMPEVRELLENYLDVAKEPSLAIRSIYGERFPLIVAVDENWARCHVSEIFTRVPGQLQLWLAAWSAFVTFRRANKIIFRLIREQYETAIDMIGKWGDSAIRLADPDEKLAEHLMTLYWLSDIPLEGAESILQRFYDKAPDALCGHAFEYIGMCLEEPEIPPPDVAARFKALWEMRVDIAHSSEPGLHKEEMAAFGRWFASGKLGDEWSLQQLKNALELAGLVKPDHMVVKRLAVLAKTFPGECVECLHLMSDADLDGWHIYGWRNSAKEILRIALQSSEKDIHDAAKDQINRFGARGFLEFRDLLE